MSSLQVNISAWAAWPPDRSDSSTGRNYVYGNSPTSVTTAPEIRFVDAMLRRRLGRLSRMALHVAYKAAAGHASITTIFASRHGELARTVDILHALAASEAPSPAAFSLSVHNSAAGIFSIARADQAPSSAIAAGEETLLWAMQDAAARLASTANSPVLLVYADEPLPEEYRPFTSRCEPPHAIAFLLCSGEGLNLEWAENDGMPPSHESLSIAMLDHLQGYTERICWRSERLYVHGGCHA